MQVWKILMCVLRLGMDTWWSSLDSRLLDCGSLGTSAMVAWGSSVLCLTGQTVATVSGASERGWGLRMCP